jgi:hypothetical protein
MDPQKTEAKMEILDKTAEFGGPKRIASATQALF